MLTQEMMEDLVKMAMEELNLSSEEAKKMILEQMATMSGIRVTPAPGSTVQGAYQSFRYNCLKSRIMEMKNL